MRVQEEDVSVRGRVCMDQTVIQLPAGSDVKPGCPVEVVSANVSNSNSVAQLGIKVGTIDYEIVTSLARRIPRIYVKGRRAVALQDLHGVSLLDDL